MAPFEPKLIKLHKGEQHTPAYLALNPHGQVPLLVIDGKPLSQIMAIVGWLVREFPDAGLLPADPWARAQALSQLAWMNTTAHPTFTAPTVALGGETLSFALTVTANGQSSIDSVSISVVSASCTSSSASLSSDEVASSRIRIGAFFSSARAIASRCRWPPDNFWPRSPMRV